MKSTKIVILFTSLLFAGPLHAGDGLVIIASSAKAFIPGETIAAEEVIELEKDQQLKLMTANGGVINLVGPYRGQIAPRSEAVDDSVLDALARVVKAAHSSEMTLAAFRSDPLGQAKRRADIWGVDIGQSGRYCVRDDQPVQLWWGDAVKGAVVEIEDLETTQSANLTWKDRAKSTDWPKAVATIDGNRYRVSNDLSDDRVEFTLTMMSREFDNDAARLAWMSDRGCELQSVRLLSDLVAREN